MATIAGHYVGPGPSGAVACAPGKSVFFVLTGDFPRARIDIQRAPTSQGPWTSDPIEQDTLRNGRPAAPLSGRFPYVEAGPWFRVVLLEIESGWATWELRNDG